MCRKLPFATGGQGRLPVRAAVCPIPCLILCLADVERMCQRRAALLHESDVARNDPDPAVGHRLIAYDAGLPKSLIRFSTLHARTASDPCPAELRARRLSPMIDLYRKKTFSTRACRW